MSLQLIVSNSLEKLAENLSQELRVNGTGVMGKETIITQTTGMNHWLSIRISELMGVFANFDFLRPNSFLNRTFRMAGLEESVFYSPETLMWPIFSILNSSGFKNSYPQIAEYYAGNDLKRLQASRKFADLFDQYAIYRPDYIKNWNEGKTNSELKGKTRHEGWQAGIWQELIKEPGQQGLDRVSQAQKLKDIILHDETFVATLKDKFPKITVFGLSIFTPLHIEIFNLLARHIQINFYLVNPSPHEYWFDTKSRKQLAHIAHKSQEPVDEQHFDEGNEILTNYGKIISDTFLMMFSDETLNTLESLVYEKPKDSLLRKLQDDVFRNAVGEDRNPISPDDLSDESIEIASSHTPIREIEALHNYLLNLFERKPGLLPKDIIVLMPEIDLYTPYITAIFHNVPKKQYIPFTIADRKYSGGDTIVGVIELLMNISEEEFTSEKVVQLLDSSYIRKRYDIKDQGLVREIVRNSYIRTGIKGEESNDTNYVSWEHGLRRIVLGYAMESGSEFLDGEKTIYPAESIEGEMAREGLRFISLVDDLIENLELRKRDRTLIEWKNYVVKHILQRFVYVKNDNDNEYKYVINQLASLENASLYIDEKLDFDVFKKALSDLLFSDTREGEFLTGAVTFSRIIPMRSLPFKVVALLGLDNQKFPRVQTEPDFNLISVKDLRRPGDRNKRDNDKHLFLETILAAQDNLYLSYNGYHLKDNSEKPPSLLVDEIIGYIEDSYSGNREDVRKVLVKCHPLASFSKKYNEVGGSLYTYSLEEAGEEIERGKPTPAESFEQTKVELDDLIRFFRNPFEWYYKKVLKIYYGDKEVLLPESETFELNNLDKHNLKSELIHNSFEETSSKIDRYKQAGQLPLANMAEVTLDRVGAEMSTIKEAYDALVKGAAEQKEHISIQVDGTLVTGTIDKIYNNDCLAYSFSNSKSKDASRKYNLTAWIRHVALIAAGTARNTYFLWNYSPNPIFISSDAVSRSEAESIMSSLLKLYRSGQEEILPFMPAESYNLIFNKKATIDSSFESLKGLGKYGFNKDFLDEYIKREISEGYFDTENPFYPEKLILMQQAAETVWGPLSELGISF